MSIASRITAMTEHIDDIYDTVELTGVDTTGLNKNLVNVPNTLKDGFVDIINNGVDTLYENFPKVSQTGEEPTLNGVYEAPMRVDLNGNTEQNSYSGKNFARIEPVSYSPANLTVTYDEQTGKISIKGTSNKTSGERMTSQLEINIPAGTYTLSLNKALPTLINYTVTDNTDTNRAFRISAGETSTTVTLPYAGASASLFMAVENGVSYDLEFYLQLESGSTPTSFEPYVGGTASPNPDYPQDIRVVKGDNTIKVTGKNLLAYTLESLKTINTQGTWTDNVYSYNGVDYTINEDLTIKTNGTASGASYLIINNDLNLTSGTDYKLNGCPTGGGVSTYAIRLYTGNDYVSQTGLDFPFTYGSQNLIRVNVFSGTNVNNLVFKPMVRLASITDDTYQPYQETTYPLDLDDIELCKIGDYKDEIRKSTGKNLFDKDNANILNVNLGYGQDNYGKLASSENARTLYIPIKSNTTYTVSKISSQRFVVGVINETPAINKLCNNVVYSSTGGTSLTITSGANDIYLCVYYFLSGTDTLTEQEILDSIQIEENPTATDYEPFGKVWYKKGVIRKYTTGIGATILSSNNTYRIKLRDISNLHDITSSTNVYVPSLSKNATIRNQSGYSSSRFNQGWGGLAIAYSVGVSSQIGEFETSEQLLNWFNNNEEVYTIINPTYDYIDITEITDTDLINQLEDLKTAKSVEGQTNITQTNEELPFILDVSGLKKD